MNNFRAPLSPPARKARFPLISAFGLYLSTSVTDYLPCNVAATRSDGCNVERQDLSCNFPSARVKWNSRRSDIRFIRHSLRISDCLCLRLPLIIIIYLIWFLPENVSRYFSPQLEIIIRSSYLIAFPLHELILDKYAVFMFAVPSHVSFLSYSDEIQAAHSRQIAV